MPAAQWTGTCGTLNNWTEADKDHIWAIDSRYTVVAEEVGDEGTPHLQFYIELSKKKSFGGWKTLLGSSNPHFEKRQGSPKQAAGYCMKGSSTSTDYEAFFDHPYHDAVFEQNGELPKQGARGKDLDQLRDRIVAGTSVDDIAMENPMIFHQYGRTMSRIEDIALRRRYRTWMTTCDWYYGPTLTGKSERAFEGFTPETHYVWKTQSKWQDGYCGQATIIINELRTGTIKYEVFLEMIDRYPFYVHRPARGRFPGATVSSSERHTDAQASCGANFT